MNTILIVLAAGLIMIAIERARPGSLLPNVKGWYLRATGLNLVQAASALLTAVTWDIWFPQLKLMDTSHLPIWLGALFGYVAITFVYYWWHRARHESPFLWKWIHQIHHSPTRLEIITSFYKHPIEIMINGALSSFILYVICGVSVEAVGLAVLLTGLAEFFYHWNIKTPYWLGFIIQRPESHRAHHELGLHRRNYSDLPLWDMLFGTFYNPKQEIKACGFSDNRESLMIPMLIGKNVNQPPCNDSIRPETFEIKRTNPGYPETNKNGGVI